MIDESAPGHRKKMAQEIRRARKKRYRSQELAAAKIGVTRQALSSWENARVRIKDNYVKKFPDVLGISQEAADEYINAELNHGSRQIFSGGSFSEWMRRGKRIDELISNTNEILNEYPAPEIRPEDGSNDYGSDEKWEGIIRAHPSGCYLLFDQRDDRAVGYWHIISIDEDTYGAGVAGENINSALSVDNTRSLLVPGTYHKIYFVDCFIRKGFTRSVVSARLFSGFLSLLHELAETRQYVERILAHASEVDAITLCRDCGFEPGVPHKFHRRVDPAAPAPVPTQMFELDLAKQRDNAFFRNDKVLANLYRKEFA